MKETAKKVLKTGFGLGLLTYDQAHKVASQVKKELNLDDEECIRLARSLVNHSEKASRDVLDSVGKQFESAVIKSGLAKKSELRIVKHVLHRDLKMVKDRLGKAACNCGPSCCCSAKKQSGFAKLKGKFKGKFKL